LSTHTRKGNLGIGYDEDGNGDGDTLVSGFEALLFLFPRDNPAVLLQIRLSNFDDGDVVLLQYSNDLAAGEDDQQALRRRRDAGGALTLLNQTTATGEGSLRSRGCLLWCLTARFLLSIQLRNKVTQCLN
jgi:hypothetical protein